MRYSKGFPGSGLNLSFIRVGIDVFRGYLGHLSQLPQAFAICLQHAADAGVQPVLAFAAAPQFLHDSASRRADRWPDPPHRFLEQVLRSPFKKNKGDTSQSGAGETHERSETSRASVHRGTSEYPSGTSSRRSRHDDFSRWEFKEPGRTERFLATDPGVIEDDVVCESAVTFQHMLTEKQLQALIEQRLADERQRISRDLHDSLGQQLTGAALLAKSLAQSLQKTDSPFAEQASELSQILPGVTRSMKSFVHALANDVLETPSLEELLTELASQSQRCANIHCRAEYVCDAPELDCGPEISKQLFLIAQEAINNALKHANASEIVVRMEVRRELIILQITDNGVGFPRASVRNAGMGLRVLQSRADMIGATLTIESERGDGTDVRCLWHRRGTDGA